MKPLLILIILVTLVSCSNAEKEKTDGSQTTQIPNYSKINNELADQKQTVFPEIVLRENSIDTFSLPFPEKEMLPLLKHFYKSYKIERKIGHQDGPDYEFIDISRKGKSILFFNFDSENKYRFEDIYVTDAIIVDQYGVRVGDTYAELKKKRKSKFNNSSNYHQHTYLYTNNSNIYYEIIGNLQNSEETDIEKLVLTEDQLKNWKVANIIWRKQYK